MSGTANRSQRLKLFLLLYYIQLIFGAVSTSAFLFKANRRYGSDYFLFNSKTNLLTEIFAKREKQTAVAISTKTNNLKSFTTTDESKRGIRKHQLQLILQENVQCRSFETAQTLDRAISDSIEVERNPYLLVGKDSKESSDSKLFSSPSCRGRKGYHLSYSSTVQALRIYYAIHGDLVLPRRFLVPSCGFDLEHQHVSFPNEWHGLDLASTVYTMKWWQQYIKKQPHRVAELNQLGFVWERLQPEWNLVLLALVTYHSLHGNVIVPSKFVVPRSSTQWPVATWGLLLGSCVHRIRLRHDFLGRNTNSFSRRQQLDQLGFVWDLSEYRFRTFYRALRQFARLKNANNSDEGSSSSNRIKLLRVPSSFVVPSNSNDWPPDLWGYPLGSKCTAVRQKEIYVKNHPERLYMLRELGFHRSGNANLGWLKVVHAAAIYSRLHQGDLNVPYHFVIPAPNSNLTCKEFSDDWPWPEHLWGLRLGQRLKDIRVKGAYLKGDAGKERRKQLDALGFNWNPKQGRRKL